MAHDDGKDAMSADMSSEEEILRMMDQLERHPDLSLDAYNGVVQWCRSAIRDNKDFLYDATLFAEQLELASLDYRMPLSSLQSLIRNSHVWHVKMTSRKVKAALSNHVERYCKGESLWSIAKSVRYPPYSLARAMLEVLLWNDATTDANDDSARLANIGRKDLKEAMRDPLYKLADISMLLRQDYRDSELYAGPDGVEGPTRLAREVIYVIQKDPMYGPKHDEVRHTIGIVYERLLEALLKKIDIPFETEEELRVKGTARTPDVLLSTPIAVKVHDHDEWEIVCWIDSKALFGDAHTHATSVIPQAESYLHRFGPGLLLYWFGHAPALEPVVRDLVVCGWTLPRQCMLPTGEIITLP